MVGEADRVVQRDRAPSAWIAAVAAVAAAAAVLAKPDSSLAAEIHRCPQPDGTTRYQDRPCGAAPAPAVGGPAPVGTSSARVGTPAPVRTARAPEPAQPSRSVSPAPPAGDGAGNSAVPPATRADYVARNARRCQHGDRRACAAVTCERSGRLDSPACQEAVGYVRGPGWDLRPRTDLFDPARATDEFTLTCRGGSRRVTLSRARGADVYTWPAAPAGGDAGSRDVSRAELSDAAREFCASP